MNRAEKRRKERQLKKRYNLTGEELEKLKNDATERAFEQIFGCLYMLPLAILKSKYGFGKKRLQRFNDELTELLKEVETGKVDLTELIKYMKEEYQIGFKIKIDQI